MLAKFQRVHWIHRGLVARILGCVLLIFWIAGFIWGCEYLRDDRKHYAEAGRFTSPDSRLDAVVLVDTVDIDNRFVQAFLCPVGERITHFNESRFFGDKVYGLTVTWASQNLFEIHYRKARISSFYNIYIVGKEMLGPWTQIVEIKLVKDGDDRLDLLHD